MKIVGCDLHARQQSIAMVDAETGEVTEKRLPRLLKALSPFDQKIEGAAILWSNYRLD